MHSSSLDYTYAASSHTCESHQTMPLPFTERRVRSLIFRETNLSHGTNSAAGYTKRLQCKRTEIATISSDNALRIFSSDTAALSLVTFVDKYDKD